MFSAHRSKTLAHLAGQTGILYLKGHVSTCRKWTDTDNVFRQESFFYYLTGINEADMHLTIDLANGESTLYCPTSLHDPDHVLWCGRGQELEEYRVKYGFTFVVYSAELPILLLKASKIHGLEDFPSLTIDQSVARTAITEARVVKTSAEIELMRQAANITTDAHIALMKGSKEPGASELTMHALFEYVCFKGGAPVQAYMPIVAFGRNGAVLHYGKNDAAFSDNRNDMLLVDGGCEYKLYASDVTRAYPIGGKFEGDYKTLYEIVLECQLEVIGMIKAGVQYEELHRCALEGICKGLVKAGVLIGEVDELVLNHIPTLFFPHGLGHFIGIDVHDCGGYMEGVERINEPGLKYLRMRRKLAMNHVITIEPGCYFIDSILDPAIADPNIAKYLNLPVLARFRKMGGVRIEDDIVVTADGYDILTSGIPKTIAEIEAVMS